MTRLSGYLLIGIGVLHTVFGVVMGFPLLAGIQREGFWNAIEGPGPRTTLFWFLVAGLFWIPLGQLCIWAERQLNRPLPAWVGWELLAISGAGAVLDPDSGFWLLVAAAIYIIVAAKSRAARSGETQPCSYKK